jgi:ribosome biogenesis GTPase
MSIDFSLLQPLGWSNELSIQLPLDQLDSIRPARIIGVERNRYRADTGESVITAVLAGSYRHQHDDSAEELPTVGDWVLMHDEEPMILVLLSRRTLIARKRAGSNEVQPIAANIDLLLIVGGLDGEYNLHRIQRYLVMAAQANITPLVLLTKSDLCSDVEGAVAEVRRQLPPGGDVLAVNALCDPLDELLAPWLTPGTTLALVGSSGVGKSTLVNNLAGGTIQRTDATRRDSKGRHTTTSRSLHRLPGDLNIIDVPGMREVGLAPTEGGVARQFSEIETLAKHCRFSDCTHKEEPGCAVKSAYERGELDADLWQHYLKLLAEERHNVSEHERRQRDRAFGKMVRHAKSVKNGERQE